MEPVDLELNPYSKPFNGKYYPFTRINKETLFKYLQHLGLLTLVQQSQYGIPVFITPKKEGTVRFIMDYLRLNQKLVTKTYSFPRIGKTMKKL